ncbi:MAG: PhoH family protein [bacterium]
MAEEIELASREEMLAVCGSLDENIDLLEEEIPVTVIPRGDTLLIEGEEEAVDRTRRLVNDYLEVLRNHRETVPMHDFLQAWLEDSNSSSEMASDTILFSRQGQPVHPRTVVQKKFVEAIRNNPVVFGVGPAGTGKTYLSMAMALSHLESERVSRIVLARPAVEAGESLGFLPGDLQEKVNPYLQPLYDAMYNLMDMRTCDELLEEGILEVVPLAFMRGRTLSDSFVILDEAQNTTIPQMKMFLTRLGPNSHAVINGDITQIDLPEREESGLVHASRILEDVSEIEFIRFSEADVVRHSIVKKIIEAYDSQSHNGEGN